MSLHAHTHAEPHITLSLSLTVEADYRNRAAFPGLRLEQAAKRVGTYLLFDIARDFAAEVLEDAENRMEELGGGRGLYQAFRALRERLADDMDKADGVLADPGLDAFKKAAASVGVHRVGTVLFDDDGREVKITGGLEIRGCRHESGAFRKSKGRFDYRPMYAGTVQKEGGVEEFLWAPGDLYDRDGGVTHLRLVHSV
jgi:hypothetical protein